MLKNLFLKTLLCSACMYFVPVRATGLEVRANGLEVHYNVVQSVATEAFRGAFTNLRDISDRSGFGALVTCTSDKININDCSYIMDNWTKGNLIISLDRIPGKTHAVTIAFRGVAVRLSIREI